MIVGSVSCFAMFVALVGRRIVVKRIRNVEAGRRAPKVWWGDDDVNSKGGTQALKIRKLQGSKGAWALWTAERGLALGKACRGSLPPLPKAVRIWEPDRLVVCRNRNNQKSLKLPARLAQSVARKTSNLEAVGSIPTSGSTYNCSFVLSFFALRSHDLSLIRFHIFPFWLSGASPFLLSKWKMSLCNQLPSLELITLIRTLGTRPH